MEERVAKGLPVEKIRSVASFFVSRVDTNADKKLDALAKSAGAPADAKALRGKLGIANARIAYEAFEEVFGSARFASLRSQGRRRPAPALGLDVDEGPVLPRPVLRRGADRSGERGHDAAGDLRGVSGSRRIRRCGSARTWPAPQAVLPGLRRLGIDTDAIFRELEEEGIQKFADSFDAPAQGGRGEGEGREGRLRLALGSFERVHRDAIERLTRERAVDRIWSGDPTLWKSEDAHRKIIENALGWLTVADRLEPELPALASFAEEASRGADRVVVLGMGGSSLAPLVFSRSFRQRTRDAGARRARFDGAGKRARGRRALAIRRGRSSSSRRSRARRSSPTSSSTTSSSTPGGSSGDRAGERFVVITDPGSALEKEATARRVRRIFPGDPKIGGRYSALSYFGLVPAALFGVDVAELLGRARKMAELCRRDAPGNPGAILGAAMAALQMKGRDKLTFSVGRPVERFGLWIEQLVAESTGKEGTGVLPVEGEPLGAPGDYGADRFFVRIDCEGKDNADARGRLASLAAAGHPTVHYDLSDALSLGAEMFRWEFATAVAGALLGIDAFDQPNVQEAKDRTNEILGGGVSGGSRQTTVEDRAAIRSLLDSIRPGDYFAITAYVPSTGDNETALDRTRLRVREAKKVATTVGFGPRFLHSTGQFHKGGPNTGVFLQVTADSARAVAIPGRPWGFEKVVEAQAAGDHLALVAHGRRVVSVRLPSDVPRGLADLDAAVAAALGSP